MRDLSPKASALLRSGRGAFRPSSEDRERILRSLTARLGEGALVDPSREGGPGGHDGQGEPAASRFSPRAGVILGGAAALAIGAGVLVGTHFWTRAPQPTQTTPLAASIPPVEPAPALLPPSPTANDPAVDSTPSERAPSSPRFVARSAPRPMSDSLAEEVRLLSKAERELNDGLGEDALSTLAEHERRFPKGALAEERMATRVEAFCALGRIAEAKTSLTRLARTFPKSAHLEGTRRFCGNRLDAAP